MVFQSRFFMFEKIFYEKDTFSNPRTQYVLNKFKGIPHVEISKIEDIFGRVKKPYIQKRTNLNLFIGEKKGHLVKETPNAYGLSGDISTDGIDNDGDGLLDGEDNDEFGDPREFATSVAVIKIAEDVLNEIMTSW